MSHYLFLICWLLGQEYVIYVHVITHFYMCIFTHSHIFYVFIDNERRAVYMWWTWGGSFFVLNKFHFSNFMEGLVFHIMLGWFLLIFLFFGWRTCCAWETNWFHKLSFAYFVKDYHLLIYSFKNCVFNYYIFFLFLRYYE